ncbi:Alpha/Beta hydrolase protein [Xylariomycetidae sp. FL2044]|nr:Alpha/Beta hydrolase protein [Xylariomycetidae sp. FL2044]
MSAPPVYEGEVAFAAPNAGKPCKTWYKVVGDLEDSAIPPLILLHGGPGGGHDYFASLVDLWDRYRIPLVMYDQVGCGRSTHFREKMGDDGFWTFDLFIAELDNLVDHLGLRGDGDEGDGHRGRGRGFFLLGQSWGGMLAGSYASRRPAGLRRLVLGGTPASFPLFVEGGRRQRAELPEDVRLALEEGDRSGDTESAAYKRASAIFYKKHVCKLDPLPDPVQQAFRNLQDDMTAYLTMQGPSELIVTGNLRDWDGSEGAKNISVDTLLLNGKNDEVAELAVEPWFRHIPRVKWYIFADSSHMPHWEERDKYVQLVGDFLTQY